MIINVIIIHHTTMKGGVMDISGVTPIKKTKLSDAVYHKLLQMINDGVFKPGEKLPPEAELCTIFGVSRTALREGIKSLTVMNILGIEHGRGTFVMRNPDIIVEDDVLSTILGRESMENMVEFRSAIDMGVARYAALNATPKDLDAMRKSLEIMEKAFEKEPADSELFFKGDLLFHYAMCRATQNPLFEKVGWPLLKYTIKRGLSKIINRKDAMLDGLEDHKKIYEAIRRKDVEASLERTLHHLSDAFDLVMR